MNNKLKTWVEGNPSPYQLHDITHHPDWGNLVVWDAFFNNLASGLMIISCLAWLAGPPIYSIVLPAALSLTWIVLIIDLLVLIADLGDPWRFFHSLRVMRFASPLSVGVWGLSCFAFFLTFAVFFSWCAFINGPSQNGGFLLLYALARLFTIMALIAAIVVICYKGVVFSCSSQPGVKEARWLTPFMVSDSLLMGLSLYILMVLSVADKVAALPLIFPMIILVCARCITFGLMWQDVKTRARKVYDTENKLVGWAVIGVCGIVILPLVFCGVFGMALSALFCLGCGVLERYWFIGLTKPI